MSPDVTSRYMRRQRLRFRLIDIIYAALRANATPPRFALRCLRELCRWRYALHLRLLLLRFAMLCCLRLAAAI